MADIKNLGTSILSFKSKVMSLSNDVSGLTMRMSENQQAQDTATAIKQKQSGDYNAMKAMTEETLTALEGAISVLAGAGTKTGLLQAQPQISREAALVQLHRVASVIQSKPLDRLLTPKQLKLIRTFAKDPAEFYDQKAQKAASYNPASATIMGILKDMYDTFSGNLEMATETEAVQFKNFETLMGVKANEMATMASEKAKKEEQKAAAEKEQAEASQQYDDTTKQMKEDTAFFDEAKKSCQAKADEWSERVRARTEELVGIDKAVEILTADDAKALFLKAIKPGMETSSFVQVSQFGENAPSMKAFNVLKAGATATGSLRLMKMAATLKSKGMFDGVVAALDTMIENIQKESQADEDEKDWCKDEVHKNEQEAARYEYKKEKSEAKLGRLNAKLDELKATLLNTIKEIKETEDNLQELKDQREADHNVYEIAKADDESAVKVMSSAIDALSAFYKNNPASLLQKQPVFDRGEKAPDGTFTAASKSSGEAGGILSIMTMIKEDLEDEITNAVKAEKENQMYHERTVAELKRLLAELYEKKTNLQMAIVDTEKAIDDEEDVHEDLSESLEQEKEYLAQIKPKCDFVVTGFNERQAKRDKEVTSLIESKELLLGMPTAPPEGFPGQF
jgi:septal ring factor EnvC (AmiA/AmiB activator)